MPMLVWCLGFLCRQGISGIVLTWLDTRVLQALRSSPTEIVQYCHDITLTQSECQQNVNTAKTAPHYCQLRENIGSMSSAIIWHNLSSVDDFFLHLPCASVMSWHKLHNLNGAGPGLPREIISNTCTILMSKMFENLNTLQYCSRENSAQESTEMFAQFQPTFISPW